MVSLTKLHRGSLDKVNQTLLPIDKTGLVGYWPFWENAGTTAYDESKNGHDGTISGATWTWLTDFAKPGLSFDGTDDYVKTTTEVLTDGGAFTLSVWLKPTNNWASGGAIRKIITEDGRVYLEYNNTDGNLDIRIYDTASHTAGYATTLSAGTWYHIVGTFDGTNLLLYLDGSQVASATGGWASLAYPFTIGIGRNLSTNPSDATMHGVMAYDRALSSGEITNIYEKTGP